MTESGPVCPSESEFLLEETTSRRRLAVEAKLRFSLKRFGDVTSTIDVARDLAASGVEDGTVIIAETQTAGRGQFGREWFSPKGGLYFTIILRPSVHVQGLGLLRLASALSAVDAIRQVSGAPVETKWPNDICLVDRKLGGILIETKLSKDSVELALIGIGINVRRHTQAVPKPIAQRAMWLSDYADEAPSVESLLEACLEQFNRYHARIAEDDVSGLLQDYKERHLLQASRVRVRAGDKFVIGRCMGVNRLGELELWLDNGDVAHVAQGEICS